ncbi:MAG: hypothetical protein WAL56_17815 [Candidatus Sulfotelmatobacter sp.]
MKNICLFVLILVSGTASPALAQVSSNRNAPVRHTAVQPISTSQTPHDEASLAPSRFRGWRHMPAGAKLKYLAQRDHGRSAAPNAATRRTARPFNAPPIPPSNGFGFQI